MCYKTEIGLGLRMTLRHSLLIGASTGFNAGFPGQDNNNWSLSLRLQRKALTYSAIKYSERWTRPSSGRPRWTRKENSDRKVTKCITASPLAFIRQKIPARRQRNSFIILSLTKRILRQNILILSDSTAQQIFFFTNTALWPSGMLSFILNIW